MIKKHLFRTLILKLLNPLDSLEDRITMKSRPPSGSADTASPVVPALRSGWSVKWRER